MRRDHRPYWLKKFFTVANAQWARHFLHPRFDEVGEGLRIINPRDIDVTGAGVRLGRHVHMMATHDNPVRFTSYPSEGRCGSIHIGDYTIVLPGVRFASALSIEVGPNCMFATDAYISDSDWHDVYDRTAAPGGCKPVKLGENVWIGQSAIVCKGVTIGDNSVIGAGAVVARDIPANVIAVGNPAKVVRELDPARELVKRERLFNGEQSYDDYIDGFDRWVLHPNKLSSWLRAKYWPSREL